MLYLSQFRAGLIDAQAQSLLVQGEIIARAIAATGTSDSNGVTIDPDRLIDLKPGETYGPSEDILSGLDFPIDPTRVAPVLRGLISPTKTRARIYDRDGVLLLDSRDQFARGDVLRFDLPPPQRSQAGDRRTHDDRDPQLAQSRRPAALSRTRSGKRQGLLRGRAIARRHEGLGGARQRPRRGDRLGRRSGAALVRARSTAR